MAFTFRAVFSGLCVLVPDRPFSTATSFGSVTVLLRNLLRPLLLSRANQVLDPHFPLLEYSTFQRKGGNREADFRSLTDLHPDKEYFILTGEQLSIELPAEDITTPEWTMDDEGSLWWLPAMEKVFPAKAKIRNGLLTSSLLPTDDGAPPAIISRFEIQQGHLKTARLSDDICKIDPPEPSLTPFAQQVALEVALEIQVPATTVTLKLESEKEGPHTLILGPRDPLDDVVEIHVQNREIDSFIGAIKPGYPIMPRPEADFEVYYDLADSQIATPSPLGHWPVPLSERTSRMPLLRDSTTHGGKCPPTAMNG